MYNLKVLHPRFDNPCEMVSRLTDKGMGLSCTQPVTYSPELDMMPKP